jgi:hypothetical protein
MKAFFILFLAVLTVFPTVSEPYQVTTNLSKDQVWVKLTQFFVLNGVSIKTVDKNSGLIQSDKIGFGTNCNLEGSDDSTAWALCNRIMDDKFFLYPQVMNGELMFLVQEIGGKTQINIHFFNLNGYHSSANGEINFIMRSTQVLEKMIGNYLIDPHAETLKIKFDPANGIFGEPKAQTDLRAAVAAAEKAKVNAENARLAVIEKKKEPVRVLLGFGLVILLIWAAVNGKGDDSE